MRKRLLKFCLGRISNMDKTYAERAREQVTEVKAALQAIYNDLNQGQRQKLLRNPAIRAMFERYGVVTDAAGKKE